VKVDGFTLSIHETFLESERARQGEPATGTGPGRNRTNKTRGPGGTSTQVDAGHGRAAWEGVHPERNKPPAGEGGYRWGPPWGGGRGAALSEGGKAPTTAAAGGGQKGAARLEKSGREDGGKEKGTQERTSIVPLGARAPLHGAKSGRRERGASRA